MTSTGQAFVKTFARRQRGPEPSLEPSSQDSNTSNAGLGAVHLDESVAQTARVWVDTADRADARLDAAEVSPPKSHVEPVVAAKSEFVVPAMPHLHTAYGEAPSRASRTMEQRVVHVEAAPVQMPVSDVQDAGASAPNVAEIQEPIVRTRVDKPHVAPESEPAFVEVTTTEMQVEEALVEETPPADNRAVEASTPAFRAVWEVDVFDVPKTVADLFFDEALFQELSEQISQAVAGGMQTMLVTSDKHGEGRTSVAMGIAIAAASTGIRVALLDADLEEPTLADDFRLDLEYGWIDTVRHGLPIKEVAVYAIEDAVTLIPLMPSGGYRHGLEPSQASPPATPAEAIRMIELLKGKFDFVVIDGPAGTCEPVLSLAQRLDTAIVVRDRSRTDDEALLGYTKRLQDVGIQGVGLVENFVAND